MGLLACNSTIDLSSYRCVYTKYACQRDHSCQQNNHLPCCRLQCQAASYCKMLAGIHLSLSSLCAAFDKGDLLYLRDEEEKRRFTEMELRDSEQQQFRKERARIEAERAAAALRAAQARKDKQGRYRQQHIATLHIVISCNATYHLLLCY